MPYVFQETANSAAMTSGQLIRAYTERLEKAGVYAPFQDAQALLAHAMGTEHIYCDQPMPFDLPLDDQTAQKAEAFIRRREKREPLARILGFSNFWGLKIQVLDRVFRPAPHTEALIDNALIVLKEKKEAPLRLLDLGTGSGCLLLALLHELPNATGVGVDIDVRSLSAAQQNAQNLGLQDRAVFIKSDWGKDLKESFDFIISHPPAVLTHTMPLLAPEMRDYETADSLLGGADGLDSYRSIVKDLDRLLKPDGMALIRVHTWDRESRLFKKAGFPRVEVKANYRQNPCCVVVSGKRKRSFLEALKDGLGF
jgi:release factor glutamine methyltransferase